MRGRSRKELERLDRESRFNTGILFDIRTSELACDAPHRTSPGANVRNKFLIGGRSCGGVEVS
jgi:hypothetical protein